MISFYSENYVDHLADLPKLRDWYSSQPRPPSIENLPHFHLWNIIKALRSSNRDRASTWIKTSEIVLETTTSMLDHILETDSLAVENGKSLTDIYAILAELAIKSGEGKSAFLTLQRVADATGLAAFRFLGAWTAFNDNDIESCIMECDKVDEPFAPLHTLLGQALLESGKIGDAVEALKVAASIDPADPLPKVQLIKAYLVIGLQTEAMRLIEECRQIVGDHIEIECLAVMTILSGPNRPNVFCEKTLLQLERQIAVTPDDFDAFSLAVELAVELNCKDWVQKFIERLELPSPQKIPVISSKLSFVLKKIGERQWYDLAKRIIDKTIGSATADLAVEQYSGKILKQ